MLKNIVKFLKGLDKSTSKWFDEAKCLFKRFFYNTDFFTEIRDYHEWILEGATKLWLMFVSTTKIGENTTSILSCLFSW